MSLYDKHVFVCAFGKDCASRGSAEVLSTLKSEADGVVDKERIRINKSGCLNQCGNGPMMVVYPEGVWYCGVRPDDCRDIVRSHLAGNQPVDRLCYIKQRSPALP